MKIAGIEYNIPASLEPKRVEVFNKDVVSWQRSERRRNGFQRKLYATIAVIEAGIIALLTITLAQAIPYERVLPVFIWRHPDGSFDYEQKEANLPTVLTETEKRAWLWQYVRLRESYASADAKENYETVSAMSAPSVRDAYQKWFNNRTATPSPTKSLGTVGTITLKYRASELIGDSYSVRFCRVTQRDGQLPESIPFIARMHYGSMPSVPLLQRVTINPGAFAVTSYPGPEQEGPGTATTECGS